MKSIICGILLSGAFACSAQAQELVYEPVNPSFGGNPFNSSHLLAIANAQNDYDPPVSESSTSSDLDRFVRSLQSRLLSSLSTQVANAIFGEDAQDEGRIVFGDQIIEFVRGLDGIELTITEADGSQTVITIPTFSTGDSSDDDASSASASAPAQSKTTGLSVAPGTNDVVFQSGLSAPLDTTPLQTKPIGQPIQ